jgi:nitrous oxidase accessory protein NosD
MLTVTAPGSAVTFSGAVGDTTPLGAINLTAASSVTALSTIEINGTGFGTNGLRIGAGVNNVNMTQPGSVIANANLSGILLVGGSTASHFAGFTMTDPAGAGITVQAGNYTGTTINAMAITGFTQSPTYGIFVNSGTGLRIGGDAALANSISNASVGIYAVGNLAGTVIDGNDLNMGDFGIRLASAVNLTIVGNNTITSASDAGIFITGTSAGTQVGGLVVNGSGVTQYGALLSGATNLSFGTATTPNTIRNTDAGIRAVGNLSGTTIEGNLLDNNLYGAYLSSTTSLTMTGGNRIYNSGFSGLYAIGSFTGSQVNNLTIDSSTATPYAIYLDGALNLALGGGGAGEIITVANSSTAVYARGSGTNTVVRGLDILNASTGIRLASATSYSFLDSEIDFQAFGIFATGGSSNTSVSDITLDGGALNGTGVYLSGATNLSVGLPADGVRVSRAAVGVFATGALTGTVVQNTSIDSVTTGVQLSSAQSLRFNGTTTISNFSTYGAVISGTSNETLVQGLDIAGNGTAGLVGGFFTNARGLTFGGTAASEANRVLNVTTGITATGDFTGAAVRGNEFSGLTTAVRLDKVSNFTLSGNNTFSNTSFYGIYATSIVTGLTVSNNTFTIPGAQFGGYFQGVRNAVIGSSATEPGNRISGASTGIFVTSNMSATTVSNNSIANNSINVRLSGALGAVVANNNLSGASSYGVLAAGSNSGSVVQNNTISTQSAAWGVGLSGASNLMVGGSEASQGNRISNATRGFFGTGALSGSKVLGNTFTGLGVGDTGLYLTGATNLTVGGTGASEPNTFTNYNYGGVYGNELRGTQVISNRFSNGTYGGVLSDGTNLTITSNNTFNGYTSRGLSISGNNPGTNVSANIIRGAGQTAAGIYLYHATNTTIGGAAFGQGNQILQTVSAVTAVGNLTGTTVLGNVLSDGTVGITLGTAAGLQVTLNTIERNSNAGITASGVNGGSTITANQISANGNGVIITGSNLSISGNNIYGNTFNGVWVSGASALNNTILSNAIFLNGGAGILLSGGGNAGQVAPTVSSVSTTRVTGTMTGTNGDWFRIQIFKNAASIVTSASAAQGQVLVSSVDVEIVGGTASIDQAVTGVIVGDWITMTATRLTGSGGTPTNTSQFSPGVQVTS